MFCFLFTVCKKNKFFVLFVVLLFIRISPRSKCVSVLSFIFFFDSYSEKQVLFLYRSLNFLFFGLLFRYVWKFFFNLCVVESVLILTDRHFNKNIYKIKRKKIKNCVENIWKKYTKSKEKRICVKIAKVQLKKRTNLQNNIKNFVQKIRKKVFYFSIKCIKIVYV